MPTPSYYLVPEKTTYSALKISPYVKESAATRVQAANLALYRECFSQIIRDDAFKLHVLMMPNMTGKNVVYTASNDEDMAASVAALTKVSVGPDDMVVIVGDDMLDGPLTEDDMLLLVMADVAQHIDCLHPVADRTLGKFGRHIGWAVVASVILGSHDLLRMVEDDMDLIDRVKKSAHNGIEKEARAKGPGDFNTVLDQNKNLMVAVDKVCDAAFETYGDYTSLPASGAVIAMAAKNLLQNVSNEMTGSLRAII